MSVASGGCLLFVRRGYPGNEVREINNVVACFLRCFFYCRFTWNTRIHSLTDRQYTNPRTSILRIIRKEHLVSLRLFRPLSGRKLRLVEPAGDGLLEDPHVVAHVSLKIAIQLKVQIQ